MKKNTIIAFIDDSKYSSVVCEYAAWLANGSKSKVKLYHVIDRKLPKAKQDLSGSINLGAKTKLLENLSEVDAEKARILHSAGWSILEKAREKLKALNVKDVETRLRSDDLTDTLRAKEQDADVIVIGKRGELKQDSDSKLGQNIERLVRASNKPILIANREFMQVKKVLVAFDGSPTSKSIVDFISDYNYFKGTEIALVSVGKKEDEISDSFSDAKIRLKSSNLNVHTENLAGDPKIVLANFVRENGFNLLMMGAYGHSKMRSYIVGSTTTRLVNTIRLPVFLLR